ncbi:hypothetical protein RRG08_048587 [Elysia crispata]|uniref:Uncharacterized protein n=1 Tax=Elysia crispata TaxID=231223 RepID=A0AAE1ADV7_9GAST|nr:hypothetical protein RRG08_048587 [Elysia crispata]
MEYTGNTYKSSQRIAHFPISTRIIIFTILVSSLPVIDSACTFPSQLTGTWVRSRDSKSLTFTSNTVSGLAVLYLTNDLGDFSCDTLSSNRYIIASGQFSADFTAIKYYMCWQFVVVNDNSFILYELSNDLRVTGYDVRPGVTQAASAAVDASTICSKTTSTTLFTTLVKTGAAESEVAAPCPAAVQANFQYGSCSSASLQACSDTKYVTADYSACNVQVFGSVGGAVSCMGSATYQGERYVNLYVPDSMSTIICWKIPDTSTAADMSTTYYSGDCTTTVSGSTDLNLVYSATCSTDSDGDDSGGGGGDSAGAIAGGSVSGVVIIVLVVLLVYFCLKTRGNKVQQSGSGGDKKKEPKENGVEHQNSKKTVPEETKVEMNVTEDKLSPATRLPPIEPKESKENGVEYQNVKNKELDETKVEMKTLEKTPSALPQQLSPHWLQW